MSYEVVGNIKQLLSMHGDVKFENAIETIKCMSDNSTIDIDEINKTSETGGLYITSDGRILDTFDEIDEYKAKYKVVPTGLVLKGTNYPLFASFLKNNNFWDGVYIGTGLQLFEMYKHHYKPADAFSSEYIKIFGGINTSKDIKGFGLASVIKDIDNVYVSESLNTVYSSELTEDTNTSVMQAALDKMKETQAKKNKSSSKSLKKMSRLQAHLAKRQQIQDKDEGDTDTFSESTYTIDTVEDTDTVILDSVLTTSENECIKETTCDGIVRDIKPDDNTDIYEYTHTVSDAAQVINELDHDYEHDTARYKYAEQSKREIIKHIYERLMDKTRWGVSGDYKKTLGFYLKGISLVVWKQQNNSNNKDNNGWVYNNDNTKCLINTGLLDTFGNYIYFVDSTPNLPDFYDKEINVMYNKDMLIDLNFSDCVIRNLPIPLDLANGKLSDLVFRASIDDFDLDDVLHFSHIIHDRIDRFPDKYRTSSDVEICNKIKSSITQAVKISQTDYRYMVPKYNFCTDTIQWLMPLYLDNSINEKPELVLVVNKDTTSKICSIQTVLSVKDAYDESQFFGNTYSTWLRP